MTEKELVVYTGFVAVLLAPGESSLTSSCFAIMLVYYSKTCALLVVLN